MDQDMKSVVEELNLEIKALNSSPNVPYVDVSLVCGMVQAMIAATMDKNLFQEAEPGQRGSVFGVLLAFEKAIIKQVLEEKGEGFVIWVPRSECITSESDEIGGIVLSEA